MTNCISAFIGIPEEVQTWFEKLGDFSSGSINWASAFGSFYDQMITKGGYKTALQGLLTTIEIAVLGLIIGLILGTVIALVKVMPKNNPIVKILSVACDIYVGFFRGTPMVVQLLLGYFVVLPMLKIPSVGMTVAVMTLGPDLGIITFFLLSMIKIPVNAVMVAIAIFGLNSGAYVSEIMRAGIQSVDPGQLEAGRAVGLPYRVAMMKIVVPQTIKNILPTLGNEFIVLIKETSIVSFIAVVDLTKAFKAIGDATYEYIIPYVMLALVYLVIVIIITVLIKLMERRLKRNER